MPLPSPHFPSQINAARIVLASVTANGEEQQFQRRGVTAPHPQSGYTLEQGTIRTQIARARQAMGWNSAAPGNTFPPPWLTAMPTLHHAGRLWRRLFADAFPAVTWGRQLTGSSGARNKHPNTCHSCPKRTGSQREPSVFTSTQSPLPCSPFIRSPPLRKLMVPCLRLSKRFSGPMHPSVHSSC